MGDSSDWELGGGSVQPTALMLHGHQGALVLGSVDAHVSLGKALTVMGLPPAALRTLPVDGDGRLQPAAVRLMDRAGYR